MAGDQEDGAPNKTGLSSTDPIPLVDVKKLLKNSDLNLQMIEEAIELVRTNKYMERKAPPKPKCLSLDNTTDIHIKLSRIHVCQRCAY